MATPTGPPRRATRAAYVPPHRRTLPPHLRVLVNEAEATRFQELKDPSNKVTMKDNAENGTQVSSLKGTIPKSIPSTASHKGAVRQAAESRSTYSMALHHDLETPLKASSLHNDVQTLVKDADEVFVRPRPLRVRPPVNWDPYLPEELRNMPKPEWMVERDAKRVAKASKIEEELWQRAIQQNESAYRSVIFLKARQHLTMELTQEEKPSLGVLTDYVAGDLSNPHRGIQWRWFHDLPRDPKVGHAHADEKSEPDKHLAYSNGKWVPATTEWLDREQFLLTQKQAQHMGKWVSERVTEALEKPYVIDTTDPDWLSGELPVSGTYKQWQLFPTDIWFRRRPIEYGRMDWSMDEQLPPLEGIYSLVPAGRYQCSEISALAFRESQSAEQQKRAEESEKHRAEAESRKEAEGEEQVREQGTFKKRQQYRAELLARPTPKVNIYIRPAVFADVPQITAIYNYYVHNSVHAEDLVATQPGDWQGYLDEAAADPFAFLVAVLKSNKASSRHKKDVPTTYNTSRDAVGLSSEIIVGFAYSEWISKRSSVYRHTAELHMYVDASYTRQGIGNALMDRIIGTLDVSYRPIAATVFVTDPNDELSRAWYEYGGSQEVRKIQVNIAYADGSEGEMEWRKKWLAHYDFEYVGSMICAGEKFGKGVNIAIMLR